MKTGIPKFESFDKLLLPIWIPTYATCLFILSSTFNWKYSFARLVSKHIKLNPPFRLNWLLVMEEWVDDFSLVKFVSWLTPFFWQSFCNTSLLLPFEIMLKSDLSKRLFRLNNSLNLT
jgi:hypothetical protein